LKGKGSFDCLEIYRNKQVYLASNVELIKDTIKLCRPQE